MTTHENFMRRALEIAATNLGQTWPNPAVGAVVVKDGKIIGEGFTARGGRPHAEPQALEQAGEQAHGASLYVTLEPCAHHGKTPPCTNAIIKAGIKHVVIATGDPAPHVNGKGIAALEEADISVTQHVCEQEAETLNRGFISVATKSRPYVALKIASSADGKIAGGKTRWITGESARNHVHVLRSQYDGILTGIGTVLADDPLLTCRIKGCEDKSPVRIVLDRKYRFDQNCQLAKTSDQIDTWIMNTQTIEETLRQLSDKGMTRILVEAGHGLNTAFLESGCVDRIYWFQSPDNIGAQGLDIAKEGIFELAQWQKLEHSAFPPDTLDILELCSPAS